MMTAATLRDEPSPLRALDWRRAAQARHNLLLEGPEASIEAVLRRLAPYLRTPVVWLGRGTPVALPNQECGALALQNVAAMERLDQARLLAWLDDPTRRTQVVSTTTYPVFPLVDCGLFDAALYYRLSMVRLFVGPDQHDDSPRVSA